MPPESWYIIKNFKCLVYGCVWVGLRSIFNPTHHCMLKKIQSIIGVQPNPHGSGWTHGLNIYIFLITIVIIKLSIRSTQPQTILNFDSTSKFKPTSEIRRRLK